QRAASERERLVEDVAETDDALMEKYMEGEAIGQEELAEDIRKATLDRKAVPVLCGSALLNKGIQPLLDAIVAYLPDPTEVPAIQGVHPETLEKITCKVTEKEPLAALVFKVSMHEGRKMCFVRVYSGKITAGQDVYNPLLKIKEKVARILTIHANKRERVNEAGAGNIVGLTGIKTSATGDTLCDVNRPVILERIDTYEPVISVAVEPKTHADQEKLPLVLEKLMAEDPTFRVRTDDETGQTIISGMGALHLDILVSRMQREFSTQVNVGRPQVVHRETVSGRGEATSVFDRDVAGARQFASVTLAVRSRSRGKGNRFINKAAPEAVPEAMEAIVEKGIAESLEAGVIMGYPVLDVAVELLGGEFRESSTELAFRVAASMALKEALQNAGPVLLEPILNVEILVPEAFTGEVIGDLNSRGGKIGSIEARSGVQAVHAQVPLSKMFGYSTDLRSSTQGRGTFTMHFSHFDQV
ncbi:MAG: EF-Tu/IF-2/RF-3 family GTPase, partial [Pseudomonadota bacterium]